MKLGNFARFDGNYSGVGLSHGNKLEPEVWDEFRNSPAALKSEVSRINNIVVGDPVAQAKAAVGGQGFQTSSAARQVIESAAMQRAIKYYENYGWNVEDVSLKQSFDLMCSKPGEQDLHVEVKGTTGDGMRILLTFLVNVWAIPVSR